MFPLNVKMYFTWCYFILPLSRWCTSCVVLFLLWSKTKEINICKQCNNVHKMHSNTFTIIISFTNTIIRLLFYVWKVIIDNLLVANLCVIFLETWQQTRMLSYYLNCLFLADFKQKWIWNKHYLFLEFYQIHLLPHLKLKCKIKASKVLKVDSKRDY